jgi:nicotinate-nucleotide adenylyltransferase
MEFFLRAAGAPQRLGIFAGSFNPPTKAHLALARAALECVDEVVFVIPRVFPHKAFEGATFEQRIAMLRTALAGDKPFSIASTEGGLFVDIATECREAYGRDVELAFICGRDAAERIVDWDYGRPGAIDEMLEVFSLLVASRGGAYTPPRALAHRVSSLPVAEEIDEISATEVRTRIRDGQPWQHLVPVALRDQVRQIYRPT